MSIDLELQQAAFKYKNKQKVKDRFISALIGVFAIVWIFPIAWTIWTSLRPYKDVRANGVFSIPKTLNLDNKVESNPFFLKNGNGLCGLNMQLSGDRKSVV
jgi:ABC-type glycerol-3-phosphate transport system permease component